MDFVKGSIVMTNPQRIFSAFPLSCTEPFFDWLLPLPPPAHGGLSYPGELWECQNHPEQQFQPLWKVPPHPHPPVSPINYVSPSAVLLLPQTGLVTTILFVLTVSHLGWQWGCCRDLNVQIPSREVQGCLSGESTEWSVLCAQNRHHEGVHDVTFHM